jgi:hypothetical protein
VHRTKSQAQTSLYTTNMRLTSVSLTIYTEKSISSWGAPRALPNTCSPPGRSPSTTPEPIKTLNIRLQELKETCRVFLWPCFALYWRHMRWVRFCAQSRGLVIRALVLVNSPTSLGFQTPYFCIFGGPRFAPSCSGLSAPCFCFCQHPQKRPVNASRFSFQALFPWINSTKWTR